ncbi:MAG: hypothetical protein ACYTKD_10660 [Planctomycetota bacterium]|jgi:type II secretory pathway component GspD/PulD (secretin)
MAKIHGARRAAGLTATGLAAVVLALGAAARAGEAPEDDVPAPEEDAPVVVPPVPVPGVADDEPAPEDVPAPEDPPGPAVEAEVIPDIWGTEDERPPAWVQQTIARDTKMRVKYVRAYQAEAIRAIRARRYGAAIEACKRALAIDPENLAIERLLSLATRRLQEHRLLLEAERSLAKDEDALGEVEYESGFPVEVPPSPRPRLPLREDMPESEASRRMKELLNQRVSMNFVEADLEYVLQTLFKISNVNIIADQSVIADNTLSLHVENVPLSTILGFIKRNYEGVDYTVTEHAVLITSPETPPLYPVSYPLSHGLIGEAPFSQGVRRTSTGSGGYAGNIAGMTSSVLGRGTSSRSSRSRGSRGGSPGGGSSGGVSAGGESYLEMVLTWVETWEDEWPQGSQWYLDRQTNTLFVLTTAEMHKRMEEILDVIDTVPIQVLVRTKFIEVLSDDLMEYGVSSIGYGEMTDRTLIDPTTGEPGLPEATVVGTTGMGVSSGGLEVNIGKYLSNTSQLMAALNALERKQRTKVLSAPHVIALNNTAATIDISKTFSYASQYQSSTSTNYLSGGTALQNASAFIPSQFDEVQVGFLMEFVPSVGRDYKNIVLDLHARVDDVVGNIEDFQSAPIIMPPAADDGSGTTPALPSGSQAVQRPVIDSREFRTRLVVVDGGTVVLGGLLKNYREKVRRKVPILGDIPLIGLLFRYQKDWVKQSNLVIVVQAQIVKPDGGRYVDAVEPSAAPPRFGIQSFGSAPKKAEWIRDLPPELERDILGGAGR